MWAVEVIVVSRRSEAMAGLLNGLSAVYLPTGFGFNMGITAVFEQGAFVWDFNTGKPLTLYQPGQDPETPELSGEDGYYAEIEYFIRCIEQDEQPGVAPPQQSRDAVAIALAERQSVLSGESVAIA